MDPRLIRSSEWARGAAVAGWVDNGLDAYVAARQALAVAHVRRAILGVVRVPMQGVAVGGGGGGGSGGSGRGDGGAVARGVAGGGVCVVGGAVGDRHGVVVHAVTAITTPPGVLRVHARRLGAAVRCVEVIYWSQTNAGNAAVVVIPMHRVSLFQPLATGCRPRGRLEILETVVHTLGSSS